MILGCDYLHLRYLTLSTLCANSTDDKLMKFSYFLFSEDGIQHFLQIVSKTMCMKCQILFIEKNKTNIFQNVAG